MDEIGLYYYVARFYDPVIAHFTQADSIVPQPGMSVAYDRYAYGLNNPSRYTDPTGHYVCEDLSYCNPRRTKYERNRSYQEAKRKWEALPDPALLQTGANFPAKPDGYSQEEWALRVKKKTNKLYEEYRKALFLSGNDFYIDSKGKIDDIALVSLVISGEFGYLKLAKPGSYNDHLGALSKQLHYNSYVTYGPPICPGGSCPSQKAQLIWLQAFEAWRDERYIITAFGPKSRSDPSSRWTAFIVDATKIIEAPFGDYNSFGVDENGEAVLQ